MDPSSKEKQPTNNPALPRNLGEIMYATPEQYEAVLWEINDWLENADKAGALPPAFAPTKIEPTDNFAPEKRLPYLTEKAEELLKFTREEGVKDLTRGISEKMGVIRGSRPHNLRPGNVSARAGLDRDMVNASIISRHPKLGVVASTVNVDLTTPEGQVDLMVLFQNRPEDSNAYRIIKPFDNLTLIDAALPIYIIEATMLGLQERI